MHTREELEETFKKWPEKIRENIINNILNSKKKKSLEETAHEMSEREFMLFVEFDNSWTIEEKLKFYYKNCDPIHAIETNEWRYKIMVSHNTEEEFLEKIKYDTTMTEQEKRDFYHQYKKKSYY